MRLIVNGEERVFEDNLKLQDVINTLQVQDKVMAAAVNMNIVKKDNWDTFELKDSDSVELLNFVGGG